MPYHLHAQSHSHDTMSIYMTLVLKSLVRFGHQPLSFDHDRLHSRRLRVQRLAGRLQLFKTFGHRFLMLLRRQRPRATRAR